MADESKYVGLLRDSLMKKERILYNLLDMTNKQAEYLSVEEFDSSVFEDTMNVKTELLDELESVDAGFENIYGRIGEYLRLNAKEHAEDIKEMQNRIREITRLSVELQAIEQRNKDKLEKIFSGRQSQIGGYRRNTRQINNYQTAMSGYLAAYESILDRKK